MGVAWIEGSWGIGTCLYGSRRQVQKVETALNFVILLLWPCDDQTSDYERLLGQRISAVMAIRPGELPKVINAKPYLMGTVVY